MAFSFLNAKLLCICTCMLPCKYMLSTNSLSFNTRYMLPLVCWLSTKCEIDTVFRKKHPLSFCFISQSMMCGFYQNCSGYNQGKVDCDNTESLASGCGWCTADMLTITNTDLWITCTTKTRTIFVTLKTCKTVYYTVLAKANKKAVLSQRWPRDACYISRLWAIVEMWPFKIIQHGGGRHLAFVRIEYSAIISTIP